VKTDVLNSTNGAPAAINWKPQRPTQTPHRWLASRVVRGQRERFCEIVRVTPAVAAELLKRNTHNRPVVRSAVGEYAHLMKSGMWRLTADGICIASDGVLINGQHRLMGVESSGVPVEMTLWFGCDRDEFRVVDGGRKRTASQILALDGFANSAVLAALAAAMLGMRLSSSTARMTINSQDVAALAAGLDEAPARVACSFGQTMAKVCNPTAAALAYWHIETSSPRAARLGEFCDGLHTGNNLTGPRLQLREWLMHGELARRNSQSVTIKRAAAFVQAWNAWISGRKRAGTFAWPHYSTLPEAE